MRNCWMYIIVLFLLVVPGVLGVEFDEPISAEDKETFDEMLTPVMKIYNFIKYAATAVAVIILLFAGITFMLNGGDPKKRDDAKHMSTYVIIGLVVIWMAPTIVTFITQ